MSGWASHRVLGVDAARGLALLGMMAVHIVSPVGADGQVSLAFDVAAGRSAALFAVLAGVGLGLLTRWSVATSRDQRARERVAVAVRALLLVLLGLALGGADSGVAVILVYYGVMFALAIPFLSLRPAALAAWAVAAALVVPVVSHLVRSLLPAASYEVPTWAFFDRSWWAVLTELTLTGYYPALPWMAYVLAGMAVGRLPLRRPQVAWWLLGGGTALALSASALSSLLLGRLGGLDALQTETPELYGRPLTQALSIGLFGTTPTGSWWWLATDSPHTATPFDLAATTGAALAVLGLFLLLLARPRWWAGPLVAVGGMPLTLYTLHVLLLDGVLTRQTPYAYLWHVLALTAVALIWRRFVGQGPLELATQRLSRGVARTVVPGRPGSAPASTSDRRA